MSKVAVIGIGNPGSEYAETFHNEGAAFVEWLAGDDASWTRRAHVRYVQRGDVTYAVTTTFMNDSGRGVRELADWLKIAPTRIVIAHDDTDQALGSVKLAQGGGSAGHNGIRSIQAALGTPDFWRIKIGARPERFSGAPHIKAENFVLNRLHDNERELLYGAFAAGAKLATKVIENETPSGPDRISEIGSVTPESD